MQCYGEFLMLQFSCFWEMIVKTGMLMYKQAPYIKTLVLKQTQVKGHRWQLTERKCITSRINV